MGSSFVRCCAEQESTLNELHLLETVNCKLEQGSLAGLVCLYQVNWNGEREHFPIHAHGQSIATQANAINDSCVYTTKSKETCKRNGTVGIASPLTQHRYHRRHALVVRTHSWPHHLGPAFGGARAWSTW